MTACLTTSAARSRTGVRPGAKELQEAADGIIKRCESLELAMHNPKAEVVYDVLAGREGIGSDRRDTIRHRLAATRCAATWRGSVWIRSYRAVTF